MLQNQVNPPSKRWKAHPCGPTLRAEASAGSAAGDRPWGRTRAGPRGAVSRWSGRSELLRFRVLAYQDSAPVRSMRVAWRGKAASATEYRWVGPLDTGRAYRGRGARKPSLVTVGTSHIVEAGMIRRKTRRYKCTKSVLGGGGAGGLSAFFGGLSISQVRPGRRSLADCWSAARVKTSTPRGVTVVEDET